MLLATVLAQEVVAVCLDRHVHPQASGSRSEFALHVTTPPPSSFSLALVMVLTMNAPRFQRKHPLSGIGSSRNASKDIDMGVANLIPICESETVVDAVFSAVVDAACPLRTRSRL